MAKQSKAGIPSNKQKVQPATTGAGTSGRVSNPDTGGLPSTSETKPDLPLVNTRGQVVSYSVSATQLVIKLRCSDNTRKAFTVDADKPHFRSAVSMAMVALNNRINPATQSGKGSNQQYLWVQFVAAAENQGTRPAASVAMSWDNDANPFDIAGFVSET